MQSSYFDRYKTHFQSTNDSCPYLYILLDWIVEIAQPEHVLELTRDVEQWQVLLPQIQSQVLHNVTEILVPPEILVLFQNMCLHAEQNIWT